MNASPDTWSTLLTASGAGAIGVIRVCGPDALTAMADLFRSKSCPSLTPHSLRDGRLRYGRLMDGDELLDDVLVAEVADAATPTFDITAHGGVRVLERILSALEARGASFRTSGLDAMAFPTANAIEREACRALRHARTERAVRFLARQCKALPHRLMEIANQASIDPVAARSALAALLRRTPAALHLIHGVTVALVGPPNSGKSTLFNRLVGRSAAVVSPHPGTTRDWISAELDMRGLPVTLIDTAGIRADADALEREAIARGQTQAKSAAIPLLVLDAALPPPADLASFFPSRADQNRAREEADPHQYRDRKEADSLVRKPSIPLSRRAETPWIQNAVSGTFSKVVLLNKVDQSASEALAAWEKALLSFGPPPLRISATTGFGLDALADLILAQSGFDTPWDLSQPAFFTARQQETAREILHLPPAEFLSSAKEMLRSLVAAE